MRKKLSLIFLGMLCFFSIHAKKIDGVIVFSDKTANVTFDIPSSTSIGFNADLQYLQKGVTYYEGNGDKKILKPDDAKEFNFTVDGKEIRMLSTVKNNKDIFLHVIIDGNLKLYGFSFTEYDTKTPVVAGAPTVTTVNSVETYLLQKGGGDLMKFNVLFFRKNMVKYLSECPNLCEKIENKEYKYYNMVQIVNYYNSNCGK